MPNSTMTREKQKPQPWPHQVRAKEFIREKRGSMLAIDMGCGKTKIAIDHMIELECQQVLVLSPLSIVDHVWPDQIKTHSDVEMTVIPLGTRVKSVREKQKRAEAGLKLAKARNEPAVVIVNYESAYRAPLGEWLMNQKWDLLVMDESHRIKSPSGTMSRWVSRLSDRVRRKLALTGTPMPHSPLDLYAQMRAIDKSIYGTNYQAFRTKYAVIEDLEIPGKSIPGTNLRETKKVPRINGYRNMEELHEKFYSVAFRVEAKDVLDLPPAIETYTRVHLGSKAQKLYDEMELSLRAEMESGEEISATNALAKLLRLQQMTSGFTMTTDGRMVAVDDSKARAMTDILEDLPLNEPLVVFTRFLHDLDVVAQVSEKLGRNCYEVSGRRKQLDQWKDEEGGVLAVQIQAGGLGLDLTKARYCIYYSLGFSLGDYLQSIARLHRHGQNAIVDYIHLVAAGTVDDIITRALQHKENVVQAVLDRIKDPTQMEEDDEDDDDDD